MSHLPDINCSSAGCENMIPHDNSLCGTCATRDGYDVHGNALLAEMILLTDIKIGDRFRKDYTKIPELCESIRTFGLLQYPVVDKDFNLCAGGRRMEALRQLGWKRVPIKRKQTLRVGELREIELEENIQRENLTWQEEVALRKEILTLKQNLYGVKKGGQSQAGIGISQNEVAEQLGVSPATMSADIKLANALEQIPELAKCKTKDEANKVMKGLLERMMVDELTRRKATSPHLMSTKETQADNAFMVGDALAGLASLPTGTFNFFNVDTPYGIDLNSQKKEQTDGVQEREYTEWSREEFISNCRVVSAECFRLSQDSSWMVWWFGIEHYQYLLDMLQETGWKVDKIPCMWNTMHPGQTMQPEVNLGRSYEPFFVCRKGQPVLQKRGRSNVFSYPPVSAQKKIHKTEKPADLMSEIYATFCAKHDKVLVPFLGSGVDIMVGLRYDYDVRGYDLGEEIKKRFMVRVGEEFKK